MKRFIEFHIIQNFAPSNLNRDDTGAPKDAVFGGRRRARVSSQCLKRSIRLKAAEMGLLNADERAVRTNKLYAHIAASLPESMREEGPARVARALAAIKLKKDAKKPQQTQYLIFLGNREIASLAELIAQYWADLVPEAEDSEETDAKKKKKAAKASLPKEFVAEVKKRLDGGKAVDLALFGRMLADAPDLNRDAACQVAHALSVNQVDRDFDYFTAMDDLASAEETGAAMIETTEFNSACYYRYAVVDQPKLVFNLQQDAELAKKAVAAFLTASALAIPSGKQNAFAAHNPPAFIGVCLRDEAPRNLVNAFEVPVRPGPKEGLSALAVKGLAEYEAKLAAGYGQGTWLFLDLTGACPTDLGEKAASLADLAAKLEARLG